jgi:hypothetical protein
MTQRIIYLADEGGVIRDKYAEIQIGINSSTTIDEIKNEMDKFSDKLNGI